VNEIDTLKFTVYAYLKGKIPLVLGFSLYDQINGKYISRGGHAVAICGFCEGGQLEDKYANIPGLQLQASRIDKFYVHDDQIGPFAKMETDGKILVDGGEYQTLKTTWPSQGNEIEHLLGVPEILIIPLYHKIRIPFEKVLASVNSFNRLYLTFNEWTIKVGSGPLLPLIEWDIHLVTISDFKQSIYLNKQLTGEYKRSILTQKLPKYLWRATAIVQNEPVFGFLMDATDIDQGTFFLMKIIFNTDFDTQIGQILQIDISKEMNMTYADMVRSFQDITKDAD